MNVIPSGIMGISKKTCLACEKYLKYLACSSLPHQPRTDFDRLLQKTEDYKHSRYAVERVGSGHVFFWAGSHQKPYNSWRLPSLPSNADSRALERVKVVGEDVLKDLGKEVREVLVKSYCTRTTIQSPLSIQRMIPLA